MSQRYEQRSCNDVQLMMINAQSHISRYAQMTQAIRQTSQLAHTIYNQLGSSKVRLYSQLEWGILCS
jgi:hypothetical protein